MNCLPLQDQETVLLSPAYVSDILLTPSSSEPTRQKRWEAEYSSDPLMVQPTAAQGQSCYDVAPDHNHRLEVSLGPDERNRSARHLRNLRDVTTSSPHSSLSYSPSPPISLTCESIPDPSESGAISERLPCGGVEGGSGHHVCHLGRALSVQNSREFAQTSRLDTDRQPEQPRWRRIFSIHHSDEDLIPGRTSGDSLDGMPRDRQERHSGIWDRLFRRRQRVHQFSDQLGSSAT